MLTNFVTISYQNWLSLGPFWPIFILILATFAVLIHFDQFSHYFLLISVQTLIFLTISYHIWLSFGQFWTSFQLISANLAILIHCDWFSHHFLLISVQILIFLTIPKSIWLSLDPIWIIYKLILANIATLTSFGIFQTIFHSILLYFDTFWNISILHHLILTLWQYLS